MNPQERGLLFLGAMVLLILVMGRRAPNITVVPFYVPEYLGYNSPPTLRDPLSKPVAQTVGGKS